MKFVKTVDKLNSFVKWFIVAAFMCSVAVIGGSIICRGVLHISFPWAEEIAKYLTVFIVYCAAAMAARSGELTRLTFVEDVLHLKEKGRKVMGIVVGIIAIGFYVLAGYSTVMLIQMISKTNQVSPALKIPMWIPYVSLIIGCVLLVINTIAHIIAMGNENEEEERREAE